MSYGRLPQTPVGGVGYPQQQPPPPQPPAAYGSPRSAAMPVSGSSRRSLKIGKCPNEALALTNCAIVSPRDFDAGQRFLLLDGQFVFNIKTADSMASGELGCSNLQRKWAALSLNQEVQVVPFDPSQDGVNCYLGVLNLQVKTRERERER